MGAKIESAEFVRHFGNRNDRAARSQKLRLSAQQKRRIYTIVPLIDLFGDDHALIVGRLGSKFSTPI
ncbi:hypothetical protein WN73_15360 [Bradyrhizobium sp. CCBAU 45394]|nr:hypothetical protein [Bradyrhizobium sp. CCBAU 45394]